MSITNENNNKREYLRYYVKPIKGSFTATVKKDENYENIESFNTLIGNLIYTSIVFDPGTPKKKGQKGYESYDAFWMLLVDDEKKEDYLLKCDVQRTFTWLLASRLPFIKSDDKLKIAVKSGDKEEVTLCYIYKWVASEANPEGGEWVYIENETYPEDRDEKIKKGIETIRSHESFKDFSKKPAQSE